MYRGRSIKTVAGPLVVYSGGLGTAPATSQGLWGCYELLRIGCATCCDDQKVPSERAGVWQRLAVTSELLVPEGIWAPTWSDGDRGWGIGDGDRGSRSGPSQGVGVVASQPRNWMAKAGGTTRLIPMMSDTLSSPTFWIPLSTSRCSCRIPNSRPLPLTQGG